MAFLQQGPRDVPISRQQRSTNNTRSLSGKYRYTDIKSVGHWHDFNLQVVLNQYGALLNRSRISEAPFPDRPMGEVTTEASVVSLIDMYLKIKLQDALRCGFSNMTTAERAGFSVTTFSGGYEAIHPQNYTPDLAFFDLRLPTGTAPNRIPGEVKPSDKWSVARGHSPSRTDQIEYKQALSQINYYMKNQHTRYSFILTNKELVAIRRLNHRGHLELSDPIPWTTSGTTSQPQLTMLLGLWYLGMLAADDQGWSLHP
ncbi:hypothetical protein BO99DRAFT_429698 [Aspergillus violaceofuscus CBS 115571]|uniref:Uncharacterized protein n=1 Tax=Aspergillus violaceofuscus (strain CBS 115571) TaxID=1450538 RepID=A0A2V5IFK3_ASPV1|nr:hypothetical protein BO99DRAFT_429698 [Aspergillus violaceofuscus CBS 115571]